MTRRALALALETSAAALAGPAGAAAPCARIVDAPGDLTYGTLGKGSDRPA